MKVGILQADVLREELQPTFGQYSWMFESVLGSAAQEHGHSAAFRVYDVRHNEYPDDLDDCDGYIITGSRHSVYDDLAWIQTLRGYVGALHDARKKLVGICFGHQLIAHALGGETLPAPNGWAVGVHRMRVVAPHGAMTPAQNAVSLLSSHKDQVAALPPHARLLGATDFCPKASFALGDHILTFQGHPEFTKPYAEALMRARETLIGHAFAPGIASLAEATDEAVVARWIVNFITDGPSSRNGPLSDGSTPPMR